ncbi:MAG TPA: hypothetical protein VGR41_04565 [Actinomycetota bacterium]|nr:hypothetical protein [Actinomycetota bacterium]
MDALQAIVDRTQATADEVLEFLDSPAGRRLRRVVATGLILSVPVVMRIPGLRRTFVGKALELTSGTALVVKLAELIRDWEREQIPPMPAL